uniref:sphinganine-1-phosphate aldolase n=1 Tax=Cuerna arida TaxID=1464854 RepID=A0A1B6H4D6_9HEMI
MEKIGSTLLSLQTNVNTSLSNRQPWQLVAITSLTVLSSVWVWQFLFQDESITVRAKKTFFKWCKKIPMVSKRLKKEMDTISEKFIEDMEKRSKGIPYITNLPESGWSNTEIMNCLDKCLAAGDYDWKHGNVSGAVYYHDQQLIQLLMNVYGKTSYTNPLHSDIFPGICKMEAEVVKITANLFHGGPKTCGTMTSGGTESIMMACKALRDYSCHERGIKRGEIVLPKTAHPAFDKAALYLNMKITHVPVDPITLAVDINKMQRAISNSTVMLVGSAPNFPYGTADNIEEIAALGRKHNIPVHVDCCLGGFLTAFMPAAGFPVQKFDFAVPGVVSLSVDPHKFGFTPKGASVVLYADKKYRHHQYTVTTDWPGGVYGSPTVNGSRSGGTIAVCWATLMHFGFEGYIAATKEIISTTKYLEEKLREIEEIYIYGRPMTSVIAFGSNKFHIFKLSEVLSAKGWNLNPLQFPSGIHICVTHMHTKQGVADRFLSDVKSAVTEIMKLPDPQDLSKGKMAMYGVAQSLPDRSIVGDITRSFLDSLYFTPQHHSSQNGQI